MHLWLDARQRGLLWNTARLGVGTATLATAMGAPLGLALARIAIRGKVLVRVVLAAPVLLPPYVVALAWNSAGGAYDLPGTLVPATSRSSDPGSAGRLVGTGTEDLDSDFADRYLRQLA